MGNKYSNRYAVYVAIGRVLSMLCGFVVPIYLTRFLSKHDYGLYSQFFTLEHFIGTILTLGIPTCIYFFYPKMVGGRKTLILNNLLLLTVTAFLGIVILNIPFVGERIFNNKELFEYVHVISIFLLFFLPNKLLEPLFVVRKNKWISVLVPPIETISRLACVIISSQIWGTLESIFFSLAVFQFMLWVFLLIYGFIVEPKEEPMRVSADLMREQLTYSLPFGFAVILNSICMYLDKIICMGTLSAEEYAIYGMAFFTIPGIRQIYDSISLVNLSNMTNAYHANESNRIVPLYQDFVRQVMSFAIPVILGVCLFADDIIRFLYTDKYIESTPFFRINVLATLISFLGAGTILRAIGKTKYTFRANLISAIVYVPIAFALIKIWGIWGAIVASVLGNILPRLFKIFYEIRLTQSSFIKYFPCKELLIMMLYSIVCLLPIAAIKYVYAPNIWICAALGVLYTVVVYLIEIQKGIFILDKSRVKELLVSFRGKLMHKK